MCDQPFGEQFERDGYVTLPEVVPGPVCEKLLEQVVGSFAVGPHSFVSSPPFRVHSPQAMSMMSEAAIR